MSQCKGNIVYYILPTNLVTVYYIVPTNLVTVYSLAWLLVLDTSLHSVGGHNQYRHFIGPITSLYTAVTLQSSEYILGPNQPVFRIYTSLPITSVQNL